MKQRELVPRVAGQIRRPPIGKWASTLPFHCQQDATQPRGHCGSLRPGSERYPENRVV